MEAEVLAFLNTKIRDEHGSTVTLGSIWREANIDSFGSVMVFYELDVEYGCFDDKWTEDNLTGDTTIKSIIERIINERKIV